MAAARHHVCLAKAAVTIDKVEMTAVQQGLHATLVGLFDDSSCLCQHCFTHSGYHRHVLQVTVPWPTRLLFIQYMGNVQAA